LAFLEFKGSFATVTRVMPSLFFSVVACLSVSTNVLVRLLGGSFAYFALACAVGKKQMCHQKRCTLSS